MSEGREDGPPTAGSALAADIRAAILAGQLGPGDRLPGEQALVARYGVSRPVVREALKALAAQGLVEARRGAAGGTFVAGAPDGTRIAGAAALALRLAARPVAAAGEGRALLLAAAAPLSVARAEPRHDAAMAEAARLSRRGDEAGLLAGIDLAERTLAEATGDPVLALALAAGLGPLSRLVARPLPGPIRADATQRLARAAALFDRRDGPGLAAELARLGPLLAPYLRP
ncbi:MAG: GntR family transcriptional regulator [Paracoccaceae bacterium]